jgi:predicted DNA binding protein
MKYLQLTLDHAETTMHPMHRFAAKSGEITTYQLLHGNISAKDINTFLLYLEGDFEGYETELESVSMVEDYDITSVDENSFYLYVQERSAGIGRKLLEAFSQPSLIVLPPIEYTSEGTVEVTVVGKPEDLHTALDAIPSEIQTNVGEIGEYDETHTLLASTLTDRQVEALRTGVQLGYYELPRAAAVEEIAEKMDCATGTAAEHLQKAESKLITALLS